MSAVDKDLLLVRFPGDTEPLASAEAEALFHNIAALPGPFTVRVLDYLLFIAPDAVLVENETGVIECDLLSLSPLIQRHLQRYVNWCVLIINTSVEKFLQKHNKSAYNSSNNQNDKENTQNLREKEKIFVSDSPHETADDEKKDDTGGLQKENSIHSSSSHNNNNNNTLDNTNMDKNTTNADNNTLHDNITPSPPTPSSTN